MKINNCSKCEDGALLVEHLSTCPYFFDGASGEWVLIPHLHICANCLLKHKHEVEIITKGTNKMKNITPKKVAKKEVKKVVKKVLKVKGKK